VVVLYVISVGGGRALIMGKGDALLRKNLASSAVLLDDLTHL
jgi:hypothetical protein